MGSPPLTRPGRWGRAAGPNRVCPAWAPSPHQSQLPALWFTDSTNVRWTRSHTGKLTRVVDRDSQRVGWRRVLPRHRSVNAPAVVAEQAEAQNPELATSTSDPPSTAQ